MADATRNCCGTSTLDECRCPPVDCICGSSECRLWLEHGYAPPAYQHKSDCAVHNEPAYPAGPCDCRNQAASPTLLEALEDMLSGWRYIREQHGDLYGVGWDRCEQAARAAITLATGKDA